jgi:DNA-binding CsgD family transcriptional regulator/tetratricopeptide (TPR) repeat protein
LPAEFEAFSRVSRGESVEAKRPSVLAGRVVGRNDEREALLLAMADAVEGRGGVVFVTGEAGIGKSRLVQVIAADAASRGVAVLRGRAVPTTTPVAYRPLAEALLGAVRAGSVPTEAELAPFQATLGRLVPEWRDGDERALDDSVLALAEAVLRFLRGVAGDEGCLLVLEDLHWADPETLTIVEYLADNLASERVLCLITVRDESASLGLDLARMLQARRASELVALRRLDDGEVAEMLDSCLEGSIATSPELLSLAARADGVPFLVEELLAVAVSSGALVRVSGSWSLSGTADHVVPLTFVDSIRRRMTALGEEGRVVLLGAAVLGRRFDWELLPAVTGLGEGAVIRALQAAVDTQIVAVDPGEGTFRFRHALSRDAVIAELLPPERARLSQRALEAIENAHPQLPGYWCELAAEVAEGAGDRGRAATLLLEAGRRALERGALTTAEATLDRARALAPSGEASAVDVEESLATVLALAGKHDRAIEVGESLLVRLGGDPSDAARRAEAHLRLARAAVAATRFAEADRRLAQASAEAADTADEGLRARIDVVTAQVAIMRQPERAVELARRALDVGERLDAPEVACEALEIIGRFERQRDLDAAETAFARAYAIAEEHGRTVWRVRALHELGTIDLLRDGGMTRLEQARALALMLGAMATVAVLDVQIAAALAIRDDPQPGLVVARRAAELARRYRLGEPLAAALAFEAFAHARAGRRDELQQCLSEASEHGEGDFDVLAAFAWALLGFVEEDRTTSRQHLERAAVALPQASGDQASGPAAGLLALVNAVDGDEAGMARWPAHEPVHFLARGFLRYAEAVVAGRAGDEGGAMRRLGLGDDALAGVSWYRHYARRLVAEAAVADRWGEPVEWLTDALRFFANNGDARIASACRSLLRKAGAPVPRQRMEETALPAALRQLGITARELEVLRLLGDGLSNKDIGARLYLSPRTVERHIASLTAKAGVARRAELVAFAARAVVPS